MKVAAGVDIGNSTTEVVLARLRPGGIDVIGTGRVPTRGVKGGSRSISGAAALVARLEREHGVRVDRAAVARLRPVTTLTAVLPDDAAEATGRLRVVGAGVSTAGGQGFAAGRPHRLGDRPPTDGAPVVAVVPPGFGFRAAVGRLLSLRSVANLVAVALADDEAVLVSNRLPDALLPVVDEVDAGVLLDADLVAVEVAAFGTALRVLTDPLRLAAALGLEPGERPDAARLALQLSDCSNATIALTPRTSPAELVGGHGDPAGWVEFGDGRRLAWPAAHALISGGDVGLARRYTVPPGADPHLVDDLWTVDLKSVADTVLARRSSTGSRAMGLAVMRCDAPVTDPSGTLGEQLGVPVVAGSESRAGWAGACSGQGADVVSAPDTVVIDLGGGTIDAVSASAAVVAAGGGQLLTTAVAALAETTAAAAEWVKRGAAHRVESAQVLLSEDGGRVFLERPAPAEAIGALVVGGPAGLLPFSRVLAPGEWRALRQRLKVEALGGNVSRALRTLDARPRTVIVLGGPAGDDEVLLAVARALPAGVAVGRAHVAGQLGHRYGVAYGLLQLLR